MLEIGKIQSCVCSKGFVNVTLGWGGAKWQGLACRLIRVKQEGWSKISENLHRWCSLLSMKVKSRHLVFKSRWVQNLLKRYWGGGYEIVTGWVWSNWGWHKWTFWPKEEMQKIYSDYSSWRAQPHALENLVTHQSKNLGCHVTILTCVPQHVCMLRGNGYKGQGKLTPGMFLLFFWHIPCTT